MALYIWVHWDNWEFDKVLYGDFFVAGLERGRERKLAGEERRGGLGPLRKSKGVKI